MNAIFPLPLCLNRKNIFSFFPPSYQGDFVVNRPRSYAPSLKKLPWVEKCGKSIKRGALPASVWADDERKWTERQRRVAQRLEILEFN